MDKLRTHLERAAAALPSGYEEIAASLRKLAADDAEFAAAYADLENLSQWLELMEKKVIATALAQQTEEQVLESAREVERLLRPYRGTMTADQLSMLGKRYQEKVLLEKVRLPRLNIFYMR